MYFEINVALNGRHFFATAPRSLTNEPAARSAYAVLCEKFPAAEGYGVTLARFEAIGRTLDYRPHN